MWFLFFVYAELVYTLAMKTSRRRQIALVLFGGTGERFGAPYPKQFVDLGKEPMFVVTLTKFSASPEVDEIYVVAEPNTLGVCRDLVLSRQIKKVKAIVKGGSCRQESARLGLEAIAATGANDNDLVLIADGDRPNITPKLISENYRVAFQMGAAVTAIPVSDSVLLGQNGNVEGYLDRSLVYLAQTPQTFVFKAIFKAHEKLAGGSFTDDASLLIHLHKKVGIVMGSPNNLKITLPKDVDTYLRLTEEKK